MRDVRLLHPELAHERACDVEGAFSEQRIGELPRDGFVARRRWKKTEKGVAVSLRWLFRGWYRSQQLDRPAPCRTGSEGSDR